MAKVLFYGSFIALLSIAGWYYARGEGPVPEEMLPVVLLLAGLANYGYTLKAVEDGDFGAGNAKVRREKYPKIFQMLVYFNYILSIGFFLFGIFLFVNG